jgi:hypothetical protein
MSGSWGFEELRSWKVRIWRGEEVKNPLNNYEFLWINRLKWVEQLPVAGCEMPIANPRPKPEPRPKQGVPKTSTCCRLIRPERLFISFGEIS